MSDISFISLDPKGLTHFFTYLQNHLAENGKGGVALFQPQSRSVTALPTEKQKHFEQGLLTSLSQTGWRRAWVAMIDNSKIGGHIDLRSHPQGHTKHRAVLGMGVDRDYRRQGIGQFMLQRVEAWARDSGFIEWIDLQVLGSNEPAITFYQQAGFQVLGRVDDMFRIDDKSEGQVLMAKKIR